MKMKQYAERDIENLDEEGNYYFRHIEAMSEEGLHSKSAIAAELAWRDRQIDIITAKLEKFYDRIREATDHVLTDS
jgi:hypothetical protein